MISFQAVTDDIKRHGKKIPILRNTNFDFDRRRMGLITPREEQSEALLDLMAGYRIPDAGVVHRFGRVSWPVGRQLQLRSELSGRATLRFIARVYDLDFDECEAIAHDLIDFQHYYDRHVTEWPRLLTVKFAHAVVLLPDFDIYLVEGNPIIGDEEFMSRWMPLFEERILTRQMIIACRYAVHLRRFCRIVAVLKQDTLRMYPTVESAFEALESNAVPPSPEVGESGPRDDVDLMDYE